MFLVRSNMTGSVHDLLSGRGLDEELSDHVAFT